jgi:uncharacterized protein DUF992
MRIAPLLALSATLLTISILPTSAQAQARTQVGVLRCQLAPTVGLIVGSRQRLRCRFQPSGPGPVENYSGAITRLGLDIGISAGGRMAWGVIARSGRYTPRALAGTYVGASGDIALGFGVGANALVGGSGRSIALQPLSVEASVGVNLALGVAGLTLR